MENWKKDVSAGIDRSITGFLASMVMMLTEPAILTELLEEGTIKVCE